MTQYIFQITIFLALLFLPSLMLGQSAQAPPQRGPAVYLLEVKETGDGSDDIEKFAEQLMLLRLRQMRTYEVPKPSSDSEPQCVPETQVQPSASQQITIGSDARHYVVKVTIKGRQPENGPAEAVLDYELVKCRKVGLRTSLAKSNQTFPYSEILSHLNSMADAIAFVLEQEREVTKIAVGFRGVTGGGHASLLSERVMERLQEAQEFEPQKLSSSAPQSVYEYTLSGRTFRLNSKLLFEVEVRNRRGRSFKTTFDGPLEDPLSDPLKAEEFYKERAKLAVDYLTFVRNIADKEQPPAPGDEEAAKSLTLARELLCVPAAPGCFSQPSPAADLLTEVVRNKKFNTEDNWALLGDALVQSGDYSRAGSAFDTAAALAQQSGKSSAAAESFKKAAKAWLEAKNFVAAGVAYDRLIQLSPSNIDAYLGRLQTYRYNNEYVNALDFLLKSLVTLPESKELKEELGFLIDYLPPTEFEPAKRVIEARKDSPGAALALPMLKKAEAYSILLNAFNYMEQTQYDLMDAELKKVEAIANQLPEQSDEAFLVVALRAFWYRDARGEFDTTLRLLQEVKQKLKNGKEADIQEIDREIANTIFKRGLARTDQALARKDFEEASEMLTRSAKTPLRFQTLSLLREVNHRLGKDKETKDLLQGLIDEGSFHHHVPLNLGLICNSYLGELECGTKAASLVQNSEGPSSSLAGLLRVDVFTLKGEYDQALAAQEEVIKTVPLPSSLAIARFYGVLLQALQQKREVTDSFKLWYDSMTEVRKGLYDIDWVFDGALRALDANSSVDDKTKTLLHDMVAAMRDRKKPLPKAP